LIKRTFKGVETSDGAGVSLTRIIGSPDINMLDPFLLLDEFGSDNPNDYIGGFPPHPHRGFETITYMINGNFSHKDSAGNKGYLTDGGVQWMTAGKGVVHSEMPEQKEGLVRGFQLWLNLPKKKKMIDPSYNDIQAKDIPVVDIDGGIVKIISGEYMGVLGPGKPHTGVKYLDVQKGNKNRLSVPIEKSWNSFIYIYEGAIKSGLFMDKGSLGILDTDEVFECEVLKENTKFLLISGEPIEEPVARGGPFVMNTRAEVMQAFEDYQSGKLG
jgi:hypothetical protein